MAEAPEVPDVYCDQFSLAQSPYGVTMTFALSTSTPSAVPGQVESRPQVVVRMSPEHAKVMTMVMRRNLKQYELEHLGDPIRLPAKLLQQMGLADADW